MGKPVRRTRENRTKSASGEEHFPPNQKNSTETPQKPLDKGFSMCYDTITTEYGPKACRRVEGPPFLDKIGIGLPIPTPNDRLRSLIGVSRYPAARRDEKAKEFGVSANGQRNEPLNSTHPRYPGAIAPSARRLTACFASAKRTERQGSHGGHAPSACLLLSRMGSVETARSASADHSASMVGQKTDKKTKICLRFALEIQGDNALLEWF